MVLWFYMVLERKLLLELELLQYPIFRLPLRQRLWDWLSVVHSHWLADFPILTFVLSAISIYYIIK